MLLRGLFAILLCLASFPLWRLMHLSVQGSESYYGFGLSGLACFVLGLVLLAIADHQHREESRIYV
jgi:hypothetical protein